MSVLIERIKENKLIILVVIIYVGMFIIVPEKALKSLENSVYYLIEMIQVLPVIFLLTVLIDAWVPKDLIIKRFGEKSGVTGSLLSLLLGSISAGPIYAAFPVCKMLISKGASITNIVIILSSWAVVKVPMLANEAKFLGAQFMVARWVLTVVAIFIMGYVTALVVKKKDLVVGEEETNVNVLQIKREYCIGCGLCVKLSPSIFEMKDKKAKVIENSICDDVEEINISIQKCPTNAIQCSTI